MEFMRPTPETEVKVDATMLAAREATNRQLAHTAALDQLWSEVTDQIIEEQVVKEKNNPNGQSDGGPRHIMRYN